MNTYEIAVLYHPDLEIDLEKAAQKITKVVADSGGKITAEDNWGKRKLAYKIKGHEHAVYVFYTVELPAETLQKVEQTLNIADEVVRFLITKPDQKAIDKAEAFKAAKAKKLSRQEERAAQKIEIKTEPSEDI